MKVLVIGSGGREHALAAAIAADPEVSEVHVAPGNPGTALFATNHDILAGRPDQVAELATRLAVDLVVVGPEAPLVAGAADAVRATGIACFGPSAAAAQLEGSKAFAKQVMAAAGVPTADAVACDTMADALAALDEFGAPYVVKNDGLAAGKGVVVTNDRAAAEAHVAACERVVIERYLDGPEVSLFAICDGTVALPMQPAQDFKRAQDGDEGPNTGGMGAYTPLPWAPAGLVDEVMERVINPTLAEMNRRGTPFVGLLYAGLALTSHGLQVVEFNARFGDPETQPLLAVLESPLGQVLYAAATGALADVEPLRWRDESAVCVVMAASGYPATPMRGGPLSVPTGPRFIHAGTAMVDGRLVAAGGRVLDVVGTGPTLSAAREAAYRAVAEVDFPDGCYRHDIAQQAADEDEARRAGRED